jgi:hypothetical protein
VSPAFFIGVSMKYKGKITDDLDLVHGKWSKANLIQKCSAIPTSADVAVGQPFMWVGDTTDYEGTTGFFTYGAHYKMTSNTPAIEKISTGGGGAEYTAGDDIKISSDNKISVNRSTLLKDTPLVGSPTAPTAVTSTRTSVIANTLFVHELVDEKQDINDNDLETDVKTIVGAINEVNSKAAKYTAGTDILIDDDTKKISVDTDTLFTSPALTSVPTAPTAALGTNTTQIATTAYVLEALKPVTILNGTDTNYLSPYSSRTAISNILLVKTGHYYSMDIQFHFTSTKASYGASEWFNIFSVGSTLKNLVGSNPLYGSVNDTTTNGAIGGQIVASASKTNLLVSFTSAMTVSTTTIWHALLSFIGV